MNTILINVIVVIVIFGLTTYINIKTKFAKDEKEAMTHVKTLALNLLLLLSSGWMIYVLFLNFLSPQPLDKISLFIILSNSFSLFYAFISLHFRKLLSLLEAHVSQTTDMTIKQLTLFEKLPCIKDEKTTQQTHQPDAD
jgi:hypothetical protein